MHFRQGNGTSMWRRCLFDPVLKEEGKRLLLGVCESPAPGVHQGQVCHLSWGSALTEAAEFLVEMDGFQP